MGNVLLGTMKEMELSNVNRISLWGTTPPIVYYQPLIQEEEKTYENAINILKVNYCKQLFAEIPSFDLQLSSYKQKHKIYITTGSEDTFSTPEYIYYLALHFKNDKRFSFINAINGVGHSVNEHNKNYYEFLFG